MESFISLRISGSLVDLACDGTVNVHVYTSSPREWMDSIDRLCVEMHGAALHSLSCVPKNISLIYLAKRSMVAEKPGRSPNSMRGFGWLFLFYLHRFERIT